ncbi:alpha/beta fold hydrolase [Streptomyces sp. SS7]|uniref:alpha/beta fold hydrolase n=1 Tax=Streptomyces sp. SS7 TaxID=3108485 RepID=UPI0030EB9569
MTHFVLVAGAFLGGWAWDEVAAELRAAGDEAHPVTLSGLAERAAEPAGQRTHVRDVVGEVERLGLRDVVLVGHSYSGIPVGQAAERIGDRLRRVVYVDASVPFDGQSFLSSWDSDHVRASIEAHGGIWPPLGADDYAGQGLTDEQIAGIRSRATAHPGATLTEGAELKGSAGDLPSTYIKCLLDGDAPPPAVADLLKGENWELVEMDTGHWPMFSRPVELARILHASAAGS